MPIWPNESFFEDLANRYDGNLSGCLSFIDSMDRTYYLRFCQKYLHPEDASEDDEGESSDVSEDE